MRPYYHGGRVEHHHGGTGVGCAIGGLVTLGVFMLVGLMLMAGCAVVLL